MGQNDVLGTTPMNWFRVTHTGNIVALIDDLLGSDMWRSEGADGRTILSGTVAPTTEGADGDFYLNTATSMLYGPKATTWPAGVSLIGAQGPQGIQGETGPTGATGAAGADGATWSSGSGVPSGGVDGDFYLRESNYDVYKKIAGTWTVVVNIKGIQGNTGPAGTNGTNGTNGLDGATWTSGTGSPTGGNDGDFYLQTTNGDIWKKTAGTWAVVLAAPAIAYLVGFVPGTTVPAQVMAAVVFSKAQRLQSGAPDSQARSLITATGSTTITMAKNGSTIGTIVFTSAGNVGTINVASHVDFAIGDVLTFTAPSSPDATFSGLSFNLKLVGVP